jgi:thymidylate synthase
MAQPDITVRGSVTKEILNASLAINPRYPITSFKSRKLNLDYAKKEVLWYLRGNRFDTSITKEAGAWNSLIQPDGGINSNYGQVIFKGPKLFDWVIEELIRDPNSRRAVMIIGDANMLNMDNNDHRCTMYISYLIRGGYLHQTVHMRSNDAIFGMTNDIFFFGFLHQMVWACLRKLYPNLDLGTYYHNANSLHIYSRHFEMANDIIKAGADDWYQVNCPRVSSAGEVEMLRWDQGRNTDYGFSNWLKGL